MRSSAIALSIIPIERSQGVAGTLLGIAVLFSPFFFSEPTQGPAAEALRAREFYRAAIAPFGKPISPFDGDVAPLVEEPKGGSAFRTYTFPYGHVLVDPRDGRVSGAGFSRPELTPIPRRIRDDQVPALARKYVRAAGYRTPIYVFGLQDLQGNNSAGIRVDYVPTYRGATFDRHRAGYVIVNRETGHLEGLFAARGPWPKPPADVRPAFDLEAARVRGMASLLKSGVGWVKENPAIPLRLSILDGPDRKGAGRLVYTMQGYDPRRVYRSNGKPDRFFYTRIDAKSGQASTTHFPILGGERRRPKPIQVPPESREWRVGHDASSLLARKVSGGVTRSSNLNFRPVRYGYLVNGGEGWRVEVGADGRFFVREIDERPTYFRATGELKGALLKLPAYR